MTNIRIANAPCSWETLDYEGLSGERITYGQMLDSSAEGKTCCPGAESGAIIYSTSTGLCTALHHHYAGYVEIPEEIARFLDMTDPDLLGLVFDKGGTLCRRIR